MKPDTMSILEEVIQSGFADTFSYDEYVEISRLQAERGETSGPNQSDSLIGYTKLNWARMRRLNKTAQLSEQTLKTLAHLDRSITLVFITETWCGDAIQLAPFVARMTEASSKLDARFMWRDQAPHLIEEFLTNGGKSIPKVIALDEAGDVLFTWGPRPAPLQRIYDAWRAKEDPKPPYSEFSAELQKWYIQDKGATMQAEWNALLAHYVNN
ncbi:MAG: thioredoxin family protein [Flavobacteriales bacterium]